jgi:hypothetical protein
MTSVLQVQFSLCMLRRLPADHLDPAKRGKLQFMYTTLFEVKLEDLVKGHLKTARLIGEAAAKCTQKYVLGSTAWFGWHAMLFRASQPLQMTLAAFLTGVYVHIGRASASGLKWTGLAELFAGTHSCTPWTLKPGRPSGG